MIKRTLYHFHFCCGLGGGAAGFNRARPRVGNVEAEWVCLGGIDVDPAGLRDFERLAGDPATMLDLFAQVLGMANAVAENCRAMVELILIERGEHPHTAEQANLPTMFGALQGVVLAATVNPRGTCAGCAYRLGTPANTSPVTTSDAIYCRQELSRFYCHADLDDQGNPVRTCVGHAKAMKQDATK